MSVSAERAAPEVALRAAAKTVLRAYGIATSPLRGLPDFIVIGGKRCGTTSFFRNLSLHPQVAPLFPAAQQIKGTHFFDTNYERGMRWYRSHFPMTVGARPRGADDPGRVTGEGCPYYLFHPRAPQRTRAAVPDAKLIVLLRNPADRAYSHYRERVRHGVEKLSFEDALAQEPARLAGEEERLARDERYYSFAHEHFAYAGQGEYARALERWFAAFPLEQFLFVSSEELFSDPSAAYARVTDFLGIPPLGRSSFERFNFHAGSPMRAETRRSLVDRFRPHNRRLEDLIDIDTGGWE